jgi:DNA-binding response OmpR family regulator
MAHTHHKKESLAGLSVLIVDNNRDAADTLAELLSLHECDARVCYDAQSALTAAPADVVILELRLPGLDGWELVRQMQRREGLNRPFYFAVTTCGTEADRARSAEAGIDLHFLKPVDPVVLVGMLKRFAQPPTSCTPRFSSSNDGSGVHDYLGAICS